MSSMHSRGFTVGDVMRGKLWLEVVGQTLTNPDSPEDRWLMPLTVDRTQLGTYYIVHLPNKCWYRYDDATLPDFAKNKLAKIGAYTTPRLSMIKTYLNKFTDSIYMFNEQRMPPEFETVGWRKDDNLFILSLSTPELYRVLDDAGIQSKGEGQEIIG